MFLSQIQALVYLLKSISDDAENKKNYYTATGMTSLSSDESSAGGTFSKGGGAVRPSQQQRESTSIRQAQKMLTAWTISVAIEQIVGGVLGANVAIPSSSESSEFLDLSDLFKKEVAAFFKNLCLFVHYVSRGHEQAQMQFGKPAVISGFVNLLEMLLTSSCGQNNSTNFETSTSLFISVTSAIASLSHGSSTTAIANKVCLGSNHSCEALTVLLGRFLSPEGQRVTESTAAFVLQRGRGGLYRLSSNPSALRAMGKVGMARMGVAGKDEMDIESVAALVGTSTSLTSHSHISQSTKYRIHVLQVVKSCVNAISCLIQQCKENQEAFASTGVGELVVSIIMDSKYLNALNSISILVEKETKIIEYSDSSIIEYALITMQALVADHNGEGKRRLSACPQLTSKALVSLLSNQTDNHGIISYLSCSIIASLCADGSEVNQNSMGNMGACQVLVTLLHKLCAFWFSRGGGGSGSAGTRENGGAVLGSEGRGTVTASNTFSKMSGGSDDLSLAAASSSSSSKAVGASSKGSRSAALFSSSFSLESSRSLANELCKALISVAGALVTPSAPLR